MSKNSFFNTTNYTATELKQIVQLAFTGEFGAKPKLKVIRLEEAEDKDNILTVRFSCGRCHYEYRSGHFKDGSVWVGEDSIRLITV